MKRPVVLSHAKPASIGTARDKFRTHGQHNTDTFLHWKSFSQVLAFLEQSSSVFQVTNVFHEMVAGIRSTEFKETSSLIKRN